MLAPGDEATASAAGLRLRAALERSFEVGGIRVHIDASVGIALFPEHATRRARAAAARRRRDVRGQAHAHRARGLPRPRATATAASGSRSSGELHGALDAGELVLHYQPKADARDRARCAASRRSCAGSTRSAACWGPTHFLPLVEQSGLTRALTAFVLDRALEEIGDLRRARVRPRRRRQPRARRPARPRPAVGGRAAARRSAASPPEHLRARGLRGRRDGRPRAHARRARRPAGDRRARPRSTTSAPATPRSATSSSCDVDELKIDRSFVMRLADGRARRRDRALAGRPRPPARAARRRRGRRERATRGTLLAELALRRGAGLLPRAADARTRTGDMAGPTPRAQAGSARRSPLGGNAPMMTPRTAEQNAATTRRTRPPRA